MNYRSYRCQYQLNLYIDSTSMVYVNDGRVYLHGLD